MCDVHKTLLAALTKHLPGITELEFMDNFRSAFAKFEKPGQAEELAAKTGEFHIAGEPVTTATKNKQGEQKNELFIAMNVKRMLFSIFKAEYEGLTTLAWNPSMTYALAEFKKITFGSAAQDRGGIMVHGQRAQISGEVYEATLPNIHGQELVFQLLKQQYPGLQSIKWAEDKKSADVSFFSKEQMDAAAAQGSLRMANTSCKIVTMDQVGHSKKDRPERPKGGTGGKGGKGGGKIGKKRESLEA
jgi:hypothetical protein